MKIVQQIVNKKVNNITPKELLKYSKQYNIPLTDQQAQTLVSVIRQQPVNIYNFEERRNLIKQIAQVTDRETARRVNELFQQLM
jgi:Mn-dependent DtxR family transcriptional regulator